MTGRAIARPGARFIDPATLARIADLELVAKTVVDGFIAGLHRAPHLGLSLDFAEHRPYIPGDDVRRIDWRLYARTDRHYVKEYEATTNADSTVVLDVSRSMAYAGGGVSKLDYARFLAATLTYFSHRQRDRVGFVAFADDVVERVPPSARHLDAVLHALDRLEPTRRGRLDTPMRRIAQSLKRRGIAIVISDFYEEPESAVAAVRQLRARGGDVIVFHVLDPAELEFPFDHAATFQDLESGERIPVVPAELRARYRELVEAHTAALARLFARDGIDYTLLNTAAPLDHALFGYLAARRRLSMVR
ncbi:MAG TPA: DUF58 domain-containing protein [Longimicrobiales bacterium]